MDIEKCIFAEDCDLAKFLESPFARIAFIEMYLIYWTMAHTAKDSRDIVMNPPEAVLEHTRKVIATMANGGLEVPDHFKTTDQEAEDIASAELIVRKTWTDSATFGPLLKFYDVKKIKSIPGGYRKDAKVSDLFTEMIQKPRPTEDHNF